MKVAIKMNQAISSNLNIDLINESHLYFKAVNKFCAMNFAPL